MENEAIPEANPQWNYQVNSIDRDRWDHMINCLIEGMKKLTVKPVNYKKGERGPTGTGRKSCSLPWETSGGFKKYTNVDPSSPKGLAMYVIAQSAPDIRYKIQKATAGPQTPVNDFQLAYFVCNNKDMAKKAECTQRNMQKAQMIAVALSSQRPSKGKLAFLGQSTPGGPLGPWVPRQDQCTLCGQKGHWREDCNPCTFCKQPEHWKRECPRF